jgi:hypothetical protein
MVLKVNMPPSSGLMPQPCPATGRRSAEAAGDGFAGNAGMGEIAELDAIEDVLPCGQVLDQHLGGEIAFRQRVDRRQCPDVLEGIGGGDFNQHLRRTVRTRPHHAAARVDVA